MALPTTVIGAYPKPPCVPVKDWFNADDTMSTSVATRDYEHDLARAGEAAETLFARRVEDALAFGVENLERCFHGVPAGVTRAMHMCCGYPDHLDQDDYPKADHGAYLQLAPALDGIAIDQVSIEDAHRHNDLALLEMFTTKTVIFGCVAVARSDVESRDDIRARLGQALQHIDPHRLVAAPDCGLGLLGKRELAMAKLRAMSAAAASF